MVRFLLPLLALGLVATACTGTAETDTTSTSSTTTVTVDPARDQLAWMLETAAAGGFTDEALAAHFTAEFLSGIGNFRLVEGLVRLGLTEGTWTVADDLEFDLFTAEGPIVNQDGDRILVQLRTRTVPPYPISQLLVTPLSPIFAGGVGEAAIRDRFAALGEGVAWGVFEVADGQCRTVAGVDPDRPLPIAGIFDLWVMAALGEAVADGTATPEEEIEVRDDLKSSLDGQVGLSPAGSRITLARLAELSVAASDSSATDHLIDRLGREAVERAMANAGVADVARNTPLLTSRELFILKFDAAEGGADEYLSLDAEGRRTHLDEQLAGVSVLDARFDGPAWDTPTLIDQVEWFAGPSDLCRTHRYLDELAAADGLGALVRPLTLNPGVPLDPDTWSEFRFKGGSELGVFSGSWRLVRSDGRVFVVAGVVTNPNDIVDEAAAIALFQSAIDLAAGA